MNAWTRKSAVLRCGETDAAQTQAQGADQPLPPASILPSIVADWFRPVMLSAIGLAAWFGTWAALMIALCARVTTPTSEEHRIRVVKSSIAPVSPVSAEFEKDLCRLRTPSSRNDLAVFLQPDR